MGICRVLWFLFSVFSALFLCALCVKSFFLPFDPRYSRRIAAPLPMSPAIPHIHIIHARHLLELNSLPLRDDVQRAVNIRQMWNGGANADYADEVLARVGRYR
jgi:hypothetical protein